jgi:hypothetical protein
VAALFPDMFCNVYLPKNHKIAENSTTLKAREKNALSVQMTKSEVENSVQVLSC